MEVLQPYPQSSRAAHCETPQISPATEEHLKQLSQLPPVPSNIQQSTSSDTQQLTPSSTQQGLGTVDGHNLQPPVATLSPSPSTSTRNTKYNSGSVAATSKTSILLKPSTFTIKKVYVDLQKDMDAALQAIWTHQIKDPLRVSLSREISKGSCVQEFMMAGKSQDKLNPTVVVSCGNEKVMKQVERAFAKLGWLQSILKTNRIAFVAVVQETRLSSWRTLHLELEFYDLVNVWLEKSDEEFSLCGRRVKCGSAGQAQCVLGGIVLLDNEPHILTAGHPFYQLRESQWQFSNGMAQNEADVSDTASESDVEESFWFDPNDEDDSPHSSLFDGKENDTSEIESDNYSVPSDSEPNGQSHPETFQRVDIPVAWEAQPVSARTSMMRNLENDWAVLSLDNLPSNVPNQVSHAYRSGSQQITGFATDELYSYIQVAYANRSFGGLVQPLPCTLQVDTHVFDTRMIVMDEILPLGCSGSWVTADDKLVGLVIAVRNDMPWLYMIPIQPILHEIKSTLSIREISMPGQSATQNDDFPERTTSARVPTILHHEAPGERPRLKDFVHRVMSHRKRAETPRMLDVVHEVMSRQKKTVEEQNRQQRKQGERESTGRRDEIDETRGEEDFRPEVQSLIRSGVPSLLAIIKGQNRMIWPDRGESWGESSGQSALVLSRRHRMGTGDLESIERQSHYEKPRAMSKPPKTPSIGWRVWHLYEKVLLMAEFRRRKYGKTIWTWDDRPRLSSVGYTSYLLRKRPNHIITAVGRLSAYTLLTILFVVSLLLWNFLYYLSWPLHGPCRLWVIQRHREILLDSVTLERDRAESRRMVDLSYAEIYNGSMHLPLEREYGFDRDLVRVRTLPDI